MLNETEISGEVLDSTLSLKKHCRITYVPWFILSGEKKKKAGFYNPKPFSNWLKPFWGIKMGLKKNFPRHFWLFIHRQFQRSRQFMGRHLSRA